VNDRYSTGVGPVHMHLLWFFLSSLEDSHFQNYESERKKQIEWRLSVFTTCGSIQGRPTYTGGQLKKNTWHYENWTMRYNLWKYAVPSAETGCQSAKRTHISVSYFHDRVENDGRLSGQYVGLLMEEDFLPYRYNTKITQHYTSANMGMLNLH
jgi:hypothetical protein